MAFEAYLTQDQRKPKKWLRITFAISVSLHAALLVVLAVRSIWHVDELSPPNVTVTFLSGAPPPPPPPPPPKKRSSTVKKVKPVEIIQPKPNEIVQPKEAPKEEPEEEEADDGEDGGEEGGVAGGVVGGVKGGVIGGVVGGVVGSSGPPDGPPVNVNPQMAEAQKISGPNPVMPEAMRRAGMILVVMAKICVNSDGSVKDVTIIKGADPSVDQNVKDAYKQRKYKPWQVNGRAVPFCHFLRTNFDVR